MPSRWLQYRSEAEREEWAPRLGRFVEPRHRLSIRLRRSHSNTSTEYSLPLPQVQIWIYMDTWIQLSEFVVSALFRDGVGNEAPLDHLDQLIWTTLNSDTESQTDSIHRPVEFQTPIRSGHSGINMTP